MCECIDQPFNQPAPKLGNQYDDDRVLRAYLQRSLPAEIHHAIEPALRALGELAGGELYQMQLADRLSDAQFDRLLREAQVVLKPFTGADGTVSFAAPAHIVAASKRTV